MTKLQKALSEQKYRAKMVKGKHGWLIKGMLFSTLALGAISINSTSVYADSWTANTAAEIATRLDISKGSYTFVEGDTFWEIGQVLNIQPTKLMELNGFKEGSQYSVPIGTVITFDGNHVTIKDSEGNTISDVIIKDEDKVDPSKPVAGQASDTPKTPVQSDNNGNVIGNSNSNGTSSNNSNSNVSSTNTNNGSNGNNNNGNNNGSNTDNSNNEENPSDNNNGNEEKPEIKQHIVSVLHKDTEGNVLLKESDVKADENSVFTANAKSFDNYTLVGNATQTVTIKDNTTITFIYKKNDETPTPPIEVEKFDVTVNYVDEAGAELATADTVKVEKGESYTATAKTIEGYTLNGKNTQTVTVDGNKTITFKYTKNEEVVEKFDVTVEYKAEDGTELATAEVTKDIEKGQVFTATAKSFDNYTLKGNVTQTVTVEGNTTITFTYTKNVAPIVKYQVTVEHKDTDGNILETEQAVEIEENKDFKATSKTFNGYTLQGEPTQTIKVTSDKTITFTYKKDAVAPIVDKTELQTLYSNVKDTVKGNYTDDSWNTFQSALNTAKTTIDNINATQTEVDTAKTNLQTSFDNLAEKPAPIVKYNVTVVHKGSDGTTLETETPVEVEKGQSYTANSKVFEGYTLNGNPSQTITVNDDETITFNYTKDEVTPPVEDLGAIAQQIEANALGNVNAYRKSAQPGLVDLASNGALQSGTSTRASELEVLYDHQRPNGSDFDTAAYEAGYQGRALNENIGRFRNTTLEWIQSEGAQQLVNAWINSVGHANNMLSSDINEGAVGAYITKNADGSYNLYFAFIGGQDSNKPTSGRTIFMKHVMEDGTFIINSNRTVFGDTFTPDTDDIQTEYYNYETGESYEIEPVTIPTVDLTNEGENVNITITYRKKTSAKAFSAVEATTESSTVEAIIEEEVVEETTEQTIESTTDEAIEEATVESSFEPQEIVDKSALIETYNFSNTLSEENYNLESWNQLMLAKAEAKATFDNSTATQAEIDEVTVNLKNAINNLN